MKWWGKPRINSIFSLGLSHHSINSRQNDSIPFDLRMYTNRISHSNPIKSLGRRLQKDIGKRKPISCTRSDQDLLYFPFRTENAGRTMIPSA